MLYLAGSPLGIFLTLRKVNPAKGRCLGSREAAGMMPGNTADGGDGLPAVERMFNLYHPFDPVGFRSGIEQTSDKGEKPLCIHITEKDSSSRYLSTS